MEAVLVEWKFQFLQWKFHCRMEVFSVEWKFGICRIAMDDTYGLPYWLILTCNRRAEGEREEDIKAHMIENHVHKKEWRIIKSTHEYQKIINIQFTMYIRCVLLAKQFAWT